jgi:hypothetical protein
MIHFFHSGAESLRSPQQTEAKRWKEGKAPLLSLFNVDDPCGKGLFVLLYFYMFFFFFLLSKSDRRKYIV